jgi:hypothetical protein
VEWSGRGRKGRRRLELHLGFVMTIQEVNWSERSACASGQHLGGHYFAYINLFLFFLPPLFKTTEGVVVGFQIFAWAPKYHKY